MQLKRILKSIGAVLAALAVGGGVTTAAAATVADIYISETGVGAGQASGSLVLPVGTANFWSGAVTISEAASIGGASPTSFLAYCVDPAHYSTAAFTPFLAPAVPDSLAAAFPTRAAAIQSLFDRYYADTIGNDANAAAFQLALWEVADDDGNLATGGVRANAGTNAALVAGASAMLGSFSYSGAKRYDLTVYRVDRAVAGQTGQDYIVATADPLYVSSIPEPANYAAIMAGLAVIGVGARHRRRA